MIQRSYPLYEDLCRLEQLTLETAMETAVDASPDFRSALGIFRGALVSERNRISASVETEISKKLFGCGRG